MKDKIKELYNSKGKFSKHVNKQITFCHIAIAVEYDKQLADEINEYLQQNNINSAVVHSTADNQQFYLRVYGKDDCIKFFNIIEQEVEI